jgi:hypothetical protein
MRPPTPPIAVHPRQHLPLVSPALNLTDNIWQYLRQAYLSNRVFRQYDDVVETSSSAWSKLSAGPGRLHRWADEAGPQSVKDH